MPLYLSVDFNNLHTIVGYYNILSKFNFQVAGLKVKVTVAFFRKNFVIAIACVFISGVYYISIQLLGIIISRASSALSGCWAQGQGNCVYF